MLGSNVTFTITATNLGTNTATAFLTNIFSSGLSFVSTNVPSPVTETNQTQFYNLGSLTPGSNITLNIVATATNAGALASTAYIGSSLTNLNPANTSAATAVTAIPPTAGLFPGVTAASGANPLQSGGTLLVGSSVSYTLSASNAGPNEALNVAGVLWQSGIGFTNRVFSNYFGSIDPGAVLTPDSPTRHL